MVHWREVGGQELQELQELKELQNKRITLGAE
jgi:hypothetical protein